SVECCCEAVGVALAPDLAVGNDVEARILLRPDREKGGVGLGFSEELLGNAPELLGAHARRKALGEAGGVDEPVRLRVAADQSRGEQGYLPPLASSARAALRMLRIA